MRKTLISKFVSRDKSEMDHGNLEIIYLSAKIWQKNLAKRTIFLKFIYITQPNLFRVGLSNLWTKLDSCIKQVNKTTSEEDESETEIDNVVQHLDESVM